MQDSLAMLRRLVAFDTTSRNSNLELIDWVRDYLDGLGVASTLVPDETGTKANLLATLGPADRPGIMLSGHTDVVPVDGQEWSSEPFAIAERDGRLYGRGASDMKSFIAIALALAPEMLRAGLRTPIHFAFSYDEEVGCLGAKRLAPALRQLPVRPKACIVGEPTEMKVIAAHKGKHSWRCSVRGHECHSSLAHQGVNAVEYAAELVAFLRAEARARRERGPFDPEFDPPYSTIHTGTIQGGTALNIVPRDCAFDFEMRYLPDDPPEALFAALQAEAERLAAGMRAVEPATGIAFELRSSFPGLATPDSEEVAELAKALTGQNRLGKVSFGTEAGLFSEMAEIPTVVCGPGSIEQAHKPDEFIALEQIAAGETFVRRLIERCRLG